MGDYAGGWWVGPRWVGRTIARWMMNLWFPYRAWYDLQDRHEHWCAQPMPHAAHNGCLGQTGAMCVGCHETFPGFESLESHVCPAPYSDEHERAIRLVAHNLVGEICDATTLEIVKVACRCGESFGGREAFDLHRTETNGD